MVSSWRYTKSGSGKAALMGGIIGGHQHIGFRQILHMGKSIGGHQPLLQPGPVFVHLALGIQSPG